MNEPERIDVNTFAELVGRSKRQIYKHIKAGRIPAVKPNANTSYQIERSEIERFIEEFGTPGSQGDTVNGHEQARIGTRDSSPEGVNGHESKRTEVNPPVEVYLALVDRLTRAERRSVELELTLRQHQNLLTEHAESLQKGRAEALEAEAKANAEKAAKEGKELELERLTEELKEARTVIAEWESRRKRPWWKRMLNTG